MKRWAELLIRAWLVVAAMTPSSVLNAADIYANSVATGANNGTSFANGYTNLSTAIAAFSDGDRLWLNAPASTPFAGTFTVTDIDFGSIIGDRGPDRQTVIFGGLKATDWVNSSGVWSKGGYGAEPYMVSYDLKQDDTSGTITGVAIDAYRAAHLGRMGIAAHEACAPYGFLPKTAGTQTAPGDGEYGYSAGTLYVNPPGTPVEADVDAKTIYSTPTVTHGLYCTDCDHTRVEGITAYWYPVANGNDGYGLRGDNCTYCELYRCKSIVSGWHPFGFAGASASNFGNYDCRITECFANGMTGDEVTTKSIGSTVFYQHSTAARWGNNYGVRNVVILTPRLLHTGAPVASAWKAEAFLSHANTGTSYSGVYWTDNLAIDPTDGIVAKHGLTHTVTGTLVAHTNGPVPTAADVTTYPSHSKRNVFIGRFTMPRSQAVEFDGDLYDRGDSTAALSFQSGFSATCFTPLTNLTVLTGNFTGGSVGFFDNYDSGDFLLLTGERTRVLNQSTTAKSAFVTQASDTGTTDNIQLLDGDWESSGAATHAIVRSANATIYNNNVRDVLSGGSNRFGSGLEGFMYHSNTGAVPTPRDFTWERANITGGSTDEGPVSVNWGSTATEKRDYLRAQWMKENPAPRPIRGSSTMVIQ